MRTWLRTAWARLMAVWHKREIDSELEQELASHLEMLTEDLMAQGLSPKEARRTARVRIGSLDSATELHRDVRGLPTLENIARDLHYAQRFLRRKPGFALTAVLTLGLGIGASTAIFSVVDAALLQHLPYKDPDRLVILQRSHSTADYDSVYSYPVFSEVRERGESLDGVAAFTHRWLTLESTDGPERVFGVGVTADFFSVLGVAPLHGRAFLPGEDEPGRPLRVILSHGLWQRRFGADPGIIGQTVAADNETMEIVGVMPPNVKFDLLPRLPKIDFWTSLNPGPGMVSATHVRWLWMVGRLTPTATLAQTQTELGMIADRISRSDGQSADNPGRTNQGVALSALTLERFFVGDAKKPLLVLLGAVGFVLLIACVNVANLLLAQGVGRQREFAIRSALGGSRRRLVSQMLTESVLLSLVGGAFGWFLVMSSLKAVVWLTPAWMTRMDAISLDRRVFFFTVAASLFTGILFGLMPALKASKSDLQANLRQSGVLTGPSHRFRSLLVIAEVALAVVLLVGAGLMINSFVRLTKVKSGFDPENVLTMSLRLLSRPTGPEQAAFAREALRQVRSLPGVKESALIDSLPTTGEMSQRNKRSNLLEGPLSGDPDEEITIEPRSVTPGYFRTLGIPLVRGRLFTDADTSQSPPVVVVSERLARQAWPGEDPIGKRLLNDPQPTVIGVVSDIRNHSPTREPTPLLYSSFSQAPSTYCYLTIRASAESLDLTPAVRHRILEIDRRVVIDDVMTMEQRLGSWFAQSRFYAVLSGLFGAIGLLLSAIGLYGVIAYMVGQKTREIGIRMALGAQHRDIFKLVVGHGTRLTIIGLTVGIAGAFALSRLLSGLLFGVTATDPATYLAVSLLLLVTALLACYLPERRATKVDPVVALRSE